MSHDLDSIFLFIHPPLAILGFFLTVVLLFAALMYQRDKGYRGIVKWTARGAWTLSLLGLITGMVWAQIAWGSYWSWDPKETLTLLYFISMTAMLWSLGRSYPRRKVLYLALLSTALMLVTIVIPFLIRSLHGYM